MKQMKTKILAVSVLILVGSVFAADKGVHVSAGSVQEGPGLGQPATAAEVEALSINVFPDGKGLPEGSGSVAEGATLYKNRCVACHGRGGLGGSADQLAGAEMGLTGEWPEKTIGTLWPYATTLFDFIRRSMPMTEPGSLTDNESYALTAYLLYLNGIVDENAMINKERLVQVKMPNVNGFINIYEQDKTKQTSSRSHPIQ